MNMPMSQVSSAETSMSVSRQIAHLEEQVKTQRTLCGSLLFLQNSPSQFEKRLDSIRAQIVRLEEELQEFDRLRELDYQDEKQVLEEMVERLRVLKSSDAAKAIELYQKLLKLVIN